MLVLSLDTSLSGGGAALAAGGRVLAEAYLEPGPGFSQRLLPGVEAVLAQAQVERAQLEGLAVTLGPGFFTGLRVAIATAQGLALGLDLPVIGVSSLRLLAEAAPMTDKTIWALADARRGLLYAASFEYQTGRLARREPDMAISPELLAQRIEAPALLLGPGARLLEPEELAPGLELAGEELDQPRPGLLALMGERRLERGQGVSPLTLRPRYCRPSDAEVRFGLPLDEYRLVQ
ncbi:MAG: tRNA (adenosine(37)-N6)-threonylcarbamoyltransferase complex dimerization subunit type 1 TsaB [Desulfarculaceae bacterium]|nr:tRNA (adenosine(37)-N6)-threonylcarbamoyltransferase complex dimerization subunit type 1 TsaB [Desulfarculaceae bacterium]